MSYPETSKINQEACAWVAKLHDAEPTPQELEAFREWMNQSPEHRSEMRRMAKRWDELNVLTELAVPVETPKARRTWQNRLSATWEDKRFAGAFAAAAVLLIAIMVSPYFGFESGASSVYSTAIGEQRSVILPDNSRVLLNTNSQIKVAYDRGVRNLHLIRGEAHFEVSKDPDRPFRVHAGKGIVRAVGTAFSVYLKEKVVELTVTEGVVEFNAIDDQSDADVVEVFTGEKQVIVEAGYSATLDQVVKSIESVEAIALPEMTRKLAWREGLLKFSGDPLEEVIEEVSRYTELSVVITDPELKGLRIGGLFKVGETDKMFEALKSGFGVQVDYVNEKLVHLSAKSIQ